MSFLQRARPGGGRALNTLRSAQPSAPPSTGRSRRRPNGTTRSPSALHRGHRHRFRGRHAAHPGQVCRPARQPHRRQRGAVHREVLKNAPLLTRLNLAGNYISPRARSHHYEHRQLGPARATSPTGTLSQPDHGREPVGAVAARHRGDGANCTLHTPPSVPSISPTSWAPSSSTPLRRRGPPGRRRRRPRLTPPPTSMTPLSAVPPTRFLTRLDLSSNRLGPKFSQAFPDAVRYLPALADLNLSGNDLAPAAMRSSRRCSRPDSIRSLTSRH